MDLETSKNLGGVGAILMFISPLLTYVAPYAGLLGLVGFILVLIALKGLGDYYNEGGIFNNALYGFMIGVVGGVVAVGAFVASVLTVLADIGISDWMNAGEWTAALTLPETAFDTILKLAGAVVIALLILFVAVVLTAWFYRKSLNSLSAKSGVGMFGTAGLILLIGAFLTIVFVGIVLIWIAVLLTAVAFFSIRRKATEAPSPPQPS